MSVAISGTAITFPDASTQTTSPFPAGFAFRNRIINGAMMIDQRNAGASINIVGGTWPVDRFAFNTSQDNKGTSQRSTTAPAGFSNSLLLTSTSAYTVGASELFNLEHRFEGYNTADLGFGTASASTVTVSFWVRSSLTGAFGGALTNSARNRSYPFSYTISAANTWEQKTVTIAGDTTGTWPTDNSRSMILIFSLGAGSTYSGTAGAWTGSAITQPTGSTSLVSTNGATLYITGIQLEKGSTATSFDYRPYGAELALCQRYFVSYGANASDTGSPVFSGYWISTSTVQATVATPVTMRTTPSVTFVNPTTQMTLYRPGSSQAGVGSTASAGEAGPAGFLINSGTASGTSTIGFGSHWRCYGTGKILASAEL